MKEVPSWKKANTPFKKKMREMLENRAWSFLQKMEKKEKQNHKLRRTV